jgi:aminopeptidase N
MSIAPPAPTVVQPCDCSLRKVHFLRHAAAAALALLALFSLPGSAIAAAGRVVLPDDAVPQHYDLEITPQPDHMLFTGQANITLAVRKATRTITLNAEDLTFEKVLVDGAALVARPTFNNRLQTATLALPAPLPVGTHTVAISYTGRIYPHAAGLFALDYSSGNEHKRALFTQFENAEARRFLPCWDEPARKATFTLTAIVPADEVAVSNMPVASASPLPGKLQRVRFAETPLMSSYLLFFALGDFERISRKVNGVDVGIVFKRGDSERASFALDAATHLLPYYNDYFGIPYPLPKLDLVAGPGESQAFDAMENWGAIFYFENALLMDPKISTQEDVRGIYITVAHEMSHQWFGDLVTMNWWDDLWLNEGFASWMENKAPDHFHPEWGMWEDAQNSNELAYRVDARQGTHPLVRPIPDVAQASQAFDTITYSKGEAVVRMLEAYVGEDAFREAVRRYLRAHLYANSVTDDLWRELDKTSANRISTIAHDFTLQAGVPLIRVKAAGETTRLTLDRFVADQSGSVAADWHVPVVARPLASSTTLRTLVSRSSPGLLQAPASQGVVVNAGQTGYFRTLYEPAALAPLITRFNELAPADQQGLLNDSRALGYSGYEPLSDFLKLSSRVTPQTDPAVLYTLAGRLRGIDDLYDDEPRRERYRTWGRALLKPILAHIGAAPAADEKHIITLLRGALITSLSRFDDPGVIDEARARFSAYLQIPSTLTGDRRYNVLSVVATHADVATWEALHKLAAQSTNSLEKRQLYELLGLPRDNALADRALKLSLTDEVEVTTRPTIISNVSIAHPELALDFLDEHYSTLIATMEPDSRAEYAPGLVGMSHNPVVIRKLHEYTLKHIPVESREAEIKAEAEIAYNANVRRMRLPEVDRWLTDNNPR